MENGGEKWPKFYWFLAKSDRKENFKFVFFSTRKKNYKNKTMDDETQFVAARESDIQKYF